MRKLFKGVLIVLLFCSFVIFSQTQKKIVVSVGEYVPWTGEKIKYNGFVCRVIREAFKTQGYNVEFKFYPWARVYNEALENKVDATAYWYISEKREQECYYSGMITEEELVFFYLKSKPMKNWKTLEDLKSYKIGATRGYTYTDEFWKLGEKGVLKIEATDNDLLNFRKLVNGRIDIYPVEKVIGYHILRTEFENGIADTVDYNKKNLTNTTGHLLFAKSNPRSKKNLTVFNKGLEKIKKKGLYKQYFDDLIAGKYTQ